MLNLSRSVDLFTRSYGSSDFQVIVDQISHKSIFVRNGGTLSCYTYSPEENRTIFREVLREENIFYSGNTSKYFNYHFYSGNFWNSREFFFILRDENGVQIYPFKGEMLDLSKRMSDGRFANLYGWGNKDCVVLMGRFYTDQTLFGLMTRDISGDLMFYLLDKTVYSTSLPYIFRSINKTVVNSLDTIWKSSNTLIMLTSVKRCHKQQSFVLRSSTKLQIHQFGERGVELILESSHVKNIGEGKIFFGNFTGFISSGSFLNILHLTNEFASLYEFDDSRMRYRIVDSGRGLQWNKMFLDSSNVFDINGDGRDEIIFTGYHGIIGMGFDKGKHRWVQILDSAVFGKALAFLGTPTPVLIIEDEAEMNMKWTTLNSLHMDGNSKTLFQQATANHSAATPNIVERSNTTQATNEEIPGEITNKEILRRTIFWADLHDCSEIFRNLVDVSNAHVRFTVPLVTHKFSPSITLQLYMSYSSRCTMNSVLGTGWSLVAPYEFIVRESHGSVFKNDERFYLYSGEKLMPLKKINNATFQIEMNDHVLPGLPILWDNEREFWKIESATERVIYGSAVDEEAKDALRWTVGWTNWKGAGKISETYRLRKQVKAWYINTRIDIKTGRRLYYNYIQRNEAVGSHIVTTDIELSQIIGSDGFKIDFKYGEKSSNEVRRALKLGKGGMMNANNIQLEKKLCLKSISMETIDEFLHLHIHHEVAAGNRLLSGMTQGEKNVLTFEYDSNQLLKKIIGNHLTSMFTYQHVKAHVSEAWIDVHKRMEASQNTQIFNLEHESKVMAYQKNRSVIVKITDASMHRTIASFHVASEQNEAIEAFELLSIKIAFVLAIETKLAKAVHLFLKCKTGSFWCQENVSVYTKDALIKTDYSSYFVVADHMSVKVFEREREIFVAHTMNIAHKISRLAVATNLFATFDGHNVTIYVKEEQVWKAQLCFTETSEEKHWMIQMDATQQLKTQFLNAVNNVGLQIKSNMIFFLAIKWLGDQAIARIHLALVTRDKKGIEKIVVREQHERMTAVKLEDETDAGSRLHFAYLKHNNIYANKLTKISGKRYESEMKRLYPNNNLRRDVMDKEIKKFNQENVSEMRSRFIFDVKKFIAYRLDTDGLDMSGKQLCFDGNSWVMENEKLRRREIQLGTEYLLEIQEVSKSNSITAYKLYSQTFNGEVGTSLLDFFVEHRTNGSIVLGGYPKYIAYQVSEFGRIHIVGLDTKNRAVGEQATLTGEVLRQESNPMYIITSKTNSEYFSTGSELRIRNVCTVLKNPTETFIASVAISSHSEIRRTEYWVSFKLDQETETLRKAVIVVPEGKQNLTGWYEIEQKLPMWDPKNVTSTERWFDGENSELVISKIYSLKNSDSNNEASKSLKSKQMDIGDTQEIVDVWPLTKTDEMFGFIGFEEYEDMTDWNFPGSSLKFDSFPLTGNSCLNLTRGQSLQRKFKPTDQTEIYVASIWTRGTGFLQAKINTGGGYYFLTLDGSLKRHEMGWNYFEVVVDMKLLADIYASHYMARIRRFFQDLVTADNLVFPMERPGLVTFCITVTVKGPSVVDHVRFTPIGHDFDIKVFNAKGLKSETILPNGRILSNTYIGTEIIGAVDETGEIEYARIKSSTAPSSECRKGTRCPFCHGRSILQIDPKTGFLENFSTATYGKRWYVTQPKNWAIRKGILSHTNLQKDNLTINTALIDNKAALRFFYILGSNANLTINFGNQSVVGEAKLPRQGDVFFLHDDTIKTSIAWINGELVFKDLSNQLWETFSITTEGHSQISNLMVLNQPRVTATFQNGFGESIQVLQMQTYNSALVFEMMYDSLGREVLRTKQTIVTGISLCFQEDFIIHKNASGIIMGTVNELNIKDLGFPYTETVYEKTMLIKDQNQKEILPGRIYRKFPKQFRKEFYFLENLWPAGQGFRKRVEQKPNGSSNVVVIDVYGNEVANYVEVPGYDHHLSTMKYDKQNRLTEILPPLYHKTVKTLSTLTPWPTRNFSIDEQNLQDVMGIFYAYDHLGNLQSKKTPDIGLQRFIYDELGNQMYSFSVFDKVAHNISYFRYSSQNELTEAGYLTSIIPVHLLYLLNELPSSETYTQIKNFHDHRDPDLRKSIKTFTTHTGDDIVLEKMRWDHSGHVIKRSILSSNGKGFLQKQYAAGKITAVIYPANENDFVLKLDHVYDTLGRLSSLFIGSRLLVEFNYSLNGKLEKINADHQTIHMEYDSAGFLTKTQDQYFSEEILYNEGGYGQVGFGDGMVMKTKQNASWSYSKNIDPRWFYVQSEEIKADEYIQEICIDALKRLGFLSNNRYPSVLKILTTSDLYSLPAKCTGDIGIQLVELLGKRKRPEYFEYSFAYGSHQELMIAKFLTEKRKDYKPLQMSSFLDIPEISEAKSNEIWNALKNSSFIFVTTKRHDDIFALGKTGTSPILQSNKLLDVLNIADNGHVLYKIMLKFLFQKGRENITSKDVENVVLNYLGLSANDKVATLQILQAKQMIDEIYGNLRDNNFLEGDATRLFNPEFLSLCQALGVSNVSVKIAEILFVHENNEIGSTMWDMELFEIDANGNCHSFTNKMLQYELKYAGLTNKVNQIIKHQRKGWNIGATFTMLHDLMGNVIQAGHKSIRNIKYHPITHRPVLMELEDGRKLFFTYDAQGERVTKKVYDSSNDLISDVFYVRDEHGRVMMDRRRKFSNTQEIESNETFYIYGPTGLLAFVKNHELHHVTKDHAGSIRVVTKNGRIVAAYDYLPYGEIFRMFGQTTILSYLYTGQELDEETGLYNYHARIYDPEIGRFYQVDPKAQYFSPYVYAGNSPISNVDPDGEFAILLTFCIAGSLVGGYLGGAAANNRWWIGDWDFLDHGTWLGIVGGGIGGAMLPLGFSSSAAKIGVSWTVGVGLIGTYAQTAAVNSDEWRFWEWEWNGPKSYAGAYQGFGSIVGLVGGLTAVHNHARKLGEAGYIIQRKVFLAVTYVVGSGSAYIGIGLAHEGKWAPWEWEDIIKPGSIMAAVNGFDGGAGWPLGALEIGKGFRKLVKGTNGIEKSSMHMLSSEKQWIKSALNSKASTAAFKVVSAILMTYFQISSANQSFDLTKWKADSYATYEALLNGIFFGKDVKSMLKNFRDMSKKAHGGQDTSYSELLKRWTFKTKSPTRKVGGWFKNIEYEILAKLGENHPIIFRAITKGNRIKFDAEILLDQEAQNGQRLRFEVEQNAQRNKLEQDGVIKCGQGRRRKRLANSSCKREISERYLENENPEYIKQGRMVLLTLKGATVTWPDYSGSKSNDQKLPENVESSSKNTKVEKTLTESEPKVTPGGSSQKPKRTKHSHNKDDDDETSKGADNKFKSHFIDAKRASTDEHITVDGSKPETLAEKLLVVLNEIPAKGLKSDRFLYYGVKGMLDGLKHTDRGIRKQIYYTKQLDGFRIGDNFADMLHSYHVESGTAHIKSFILIDENVYSKLFETSYDLDKAIMAHMQSLKFVLEGDKTTKLSSMVYVFYKHNIDKSATTSLLVISPETDIQSSKAGSKEILFEEIKSQEQKDDSAIYETVSNSIKNIADVEQSQLETIINQHTALCKIFMDVADTFASMESQLSVTRVNSDINEHERVYLNPLEYGFQGYIFFLLRMGYAERFGLSLKTEMLTGKGYSDIVGVSRFKKDENNNIAEDSWLGMPFIAELKYDENEPNSIIQIVQKGYHYNLYLRSNFKHVILFGVNPLAANDKVVVRVEPVPPKLILGLELISVHGKDEGIKTDNVIKNLINCIQAQHMTSPNEVWKTGNIKNWGSVRLLGNLSQTKAGVEVYFLNSSQRKGGPYEKRILLVSKDNNNAAKITEISYIEKQKGKVDMNSLSGINDAIKPEGIGDVVSYEKVRIMINPEKVEKRSGKTYYPPQTDAFPIPDSISAKQKQATIAEGYYLENIEVLEVNFDETAIERAVGLDKLSQIDVKVLLLKPEGATQEATRAEFKKLADNYVKLLNLFPQEANIQGYLMGLFETSPTTLGDGRVQKTEVFAEANVNQKGRVDLMLRTYLEEGGNVIQSDQTLIGIEVKSLSGKDISISQEVLEKAVIQNRDYVNYNIATDANRALLFTLVFDTRPQSTERLLHYVEEVIIGHNSKYTTPEMQPVPDNRFFEDVPKIEYMDIQGEHGEKKRSKRNIKASLDNSGCNSSWNDAKFKSFKLFCTNGAWNGNAFDRSGITCKANEGSKFTVFSNNIVNSVVSHAPNSNFVSGDNFDSSSCKPIEYNGKPSVTCEGDKTSFVFTPNSNYFDRIFDNLDANIMLIRVIAQCVSNIWKPKVQTKILQTKISDEIFSSLKSKLSEVEKLVQGNEDYQWTAYILEDCRDQFESFGRKESVDDDSFLALTDTINAIYEDVQEQLEISFENVRPNDGHHIARVKNKFKMHPEFSQTRNSFEISEVLSHRSRTEITSRTQNQLLQ